MLLEHRSSLRLSKIIKVNNIYEEPTPPAEDPDVVAERARVMKNHSDIICVRGMRKEYPDGKNKTKVSNLPKRYQPLIVISGCSSELLAWNSERRMLWATWHEWCRYN